MREVAYAPQEPAGNAWGAACAPRDLVRALRAHAEAEHARAARHDLLQFCFGIEIQPDRNAEAVAQRICQKPGARRRTDQGERREIDLHRTRRRPLTDDQIELE